MRCWPGGYSACNLSYYAVSAIANYLSLTTPIERYSQLHFLVGGRNPLLNTSVEYEKEDNSVFSAWGPVLYSALALNNLV